MRRRTGNGVARREITRNRIGVSVLLAAAAVTGCGGDGPESGGSTTVVVDTISGVERLTYSEEPAPSLGWTVDTVAIIGDAMGAEEYQFSSLSPDGLAGDDEGAIMLLDRDRARVLEYGPDGAHRATYGRRGEGPGELSFPAGVALGPGDTIWVSDVMNRRLTGYPRGGGDARSVPFPRGDGFPGSRIALWDGGFYQVAGAVSETPGETIPEPLLRLDPELHPLDTLWTPPSQPVDMVQLDLHGRQIMIAMPQEFWPEFQWRTLSNGDVVVADSADYVFRILAGDGTVRRIVRRSPPARTATEADRQAVRDDILGEDGAGFSLSVNGNSPDEAGQRRMAEQRVEAMTFADRIPRIVGLQVDREDRIWVGVSEDSADVVQRIDIYDSDGSLLGELRDVPFPRAFTGSDRILTTRTDELDVPQVVVMRVNEGAAAAGG